MFVGLYEHKGGKPDGSVIVIPLQKMLETGKISFLRTKDFRLPKTLQFPMKTLSEQLQALKAAPKANTLTDDEFADGLWKLGTDKGGNINWTSQFELDEGLACENGEILLSAIDGLGIDECTGSGIHEDGEAEVAASLDTCDDTNEQPVADESASEQLGAGGSSADFTEAEQSAFDEYEVLQERLQHYSSYGGGTDELTGKAVRDRAGTRRPTSVSARLWGS